MTGRYNHQSYNPTFCLELTLHFIYNGIKLVFHVVNFPAARETVSSVQLADSDLERTRLSATSASRCTLSPLERSALMICFFSITRASVFAREQLLQAAAGSPPRAMPRTSMWGTNLYIVIV